MKDNYKLDPLRVKTRKNSRAKGNRFELEISKIFNEHFCTKEFCRSPGSGAFGTSHGNLPDYMKIYGDLITPKNFSFIIECKSGYEDKLKIADLLNSNSLFYKIIKKAEEDSLKAFGVKDKYILILKQNRKTNLVFTPLPVSSRKILIIRNLNHELTCLELKDFLSLPRDFFFQSELT